MPAVRTFAVTYPQLMNQAQGLGLTREDCAGLRQVCEVAEEMFSGWYRAQGDPFICHLVRSASISLAEQQPLVSARGMLVHAAYMMGVFSDGGSGCATPEHRMDLRRRVGAETEESVFQYHTFPWGNAQEIASHLLKVPQYNSETKRIIAMRLANQLEDWLDLSLAYSRKVHKERDYRVPVVQLALALGFNDLATELNAAHSMLMSANVPASLIRDRPSSYQLPILLRKKDQARQGF